MAPCGMGFPAPEARIIADLKPGQEIEIQPGYGDPPAQAKRTAIIAAVQGFSALACDGTMLCCEDGLGVKPTGNQFADFTLSEKAKQILEQACLRDSAIP